MPLPEGYIWVRKGAWRIALRAGLEEMLGRTGIDDPAALAATGERRFRGRGRPVSVVLPDGTRGVLRRYLHGGLLRGITGALFLGPPRPLRELVASERARAAGVAVPEVLAAMHRRVALFLHTGYILTRERIGARDLVDRIAAGEPVGRALELAGRETRRMHEAGVWHADLHAKNVLVLDDEVALIDFDRARVIDPLPPRLSLQNLLRFDRSLEKLGRRGRRLSGPDRLRFFRGYFGGRPEPAVRDELLRRCRRSLRRHRAWWLLGGGGR